MCFYGARRGFCAFQQFLVSFNVFECVQFDLQRPKSLSFSLSRSLCFDDVCTAKRLKNSIRHACIPHALFSNVFVSPLPPASVCVCVFFVFVSIRFTLSRGDGVGHGLRVLVQIDFAVSILINIIFINDICGCNSTQLALSICCWWSRKENHFHSFFSCNLAIAQLLHQ